MTGSRFHPFFMCNTNYNPTLLYVDNHLIVYNKPARMLTQPDSTGDMALSEYAADFVAKKYNKPGKAFIGIVHRLDRQVSGVVVLARTSKAASRLSDQIRKRTVEKEYSAMVSGAPPQQARWVDQLHYNNSAKECILELSCNNPHRDVSLIHVRLITGRKHQIRQQCAMHGHPIVGDRRYGSSASYSPGIALHCGLMRIQHPTTKEILTFTSQAPFTPNKQ